MQELTLCAKLCDGAYRDIPLADKIVNLLYFCTRLTSTLLKLFSIFTILCEHGTKHILKISLTNKISQNEK